MGIKLQDLVFREKLELNNLAGRIIAVDAPNIIMSLFTFRRKINNKSTTSLILDRTQRPISHLYGLLYRINFLYSKKIFPIFCFDGKDSDLKKLKTKDRLNDFRFIKNWYQKAYESGNWQLARQIASSREYKWQNIINESKTLLSALGVPFIESPASAESQCADLVKKKIAYYTNSQDYDSLLFGCPRLIQNLSKSHKRKIQGRWSYQKIIPSEINLKKTLKELGLNQFQLVDIALLMETDYFKGIHSIGPKTALKLIKKYTNIETVIQKESEKYDFSTLNSELITKVRKIFLFPEVLEINSPVIWNYPNEKRVKYLLCEEHYLNYERVEKNLKILIRNYEKTKGFFQSPILRERKIQKTLDSHI